MLAAEAGFALSIIALSLLERRFRVFYRVYAFSTGATRSVTRRYRSMISAVRSKSRLAAMALPHLLFFAVAIAVHTSVGHVFAPFTQGAGMVLLACVRPAIRTVLLLYSVDVEELPTPIFPATPQDRETPVQLLKFAADSPKTPADQIRGSLRRRKGRPSEEAQERARDVADEIENDGAGANVKPRTRVRINETPSMEGKALVPSRESTFVTPRPRRRRQQDEEVREALEIATLRFWVVFGLVWAGRSMMWYFSPSMFENVVLQVDNWLFYFFLWAQLGMTSGANAVYRAIASVARRRWRLEDDDNVKKLGLLLRVAVASGIVHAEKAESLKTNVAEGGLALLGLVFLITPRVATYVGTVIIGLLVPCYLSTAVLEAGDGLGMGRHNWLSYWGVFSLVDAGFAATADMFGWLPLWYHVKMCIVLWLQLPYYRGSVIVLDWVMDHVGSALSSVKKQVVTPRKRKRA